MKKEKINILTPFNREENLLEILLFLKDQAIHWVPIVSSEKKWIFDLVFSLVPEINSTVTPMYICGIENGWDASYFKLNHAIKKLNIIDEEYYCFMMDDDSYESCVFSEILKMNTAAVFISMKRGNAIPVGAVPHGTTTLIAHPDNIVVNKVGAEQLFVKGFVLKEYLFENYSGADGKFAEWLKLNYQCAYRPDLFALFNYLEPGRWLKSPSN